MVTFFAYPAASYSIDVIIVKVEITGTYRLIKTLNFSFSSWFTPIWTKLSNKKKFSHLHNTWWEISGTEGAGYAKKVTNGLQIEYKILVGHKKGVIGLCIQFSLTIYFCFIMNLIGWGVSRVKFTWTQICNGMPVHVKYWRIYFFKYIEFFIKIKAKFQVNGFSSFELGKLPACPKNMYKLYSIIHSGFWRCMESHK